MLIPAFGVVNAYGGFTSSYYNAMGFYILGTKSLKLQALDTLANAFISKFGQSSPYYFSLHRCQCESLNTETLRAATKAD